MSRKGGVEVNAEPKVLGFIIWLLSRQDAIKKKTPAGTNMEASVQNEFPHVAQLSGPKKINREFWSWEEGEEGSPDSQHVHI